MFFYFFSYKIIWRSQINQNNKQTYHFLFVVTLRRKKKTCTSYQKLVGYIVSFKFLRVVPVELATRRYIASYSNLVSYEKIHYCQRFNYQIMFHFNIQIFHNVVTRYLKQAQVQKLSDLIYRYFEISILIDILYIVIFKIM